VPLQLKAGTGLGPRAGAGEEEDVEEDDGGIDEAGQWATAESPQAVRVDASVLKR
jgi:hypothetical protein